MYLIAATREGVRCSNVVKVAIGPNHVSGHRPVLEAVALPPNPMRSAPYLGLRGVGPTPAGPDHRAIYIAFQTVVIDGIEHRRTPFGGIGSAGRLEEGKASAVLLDLGLYTPQIDLETAGSLLVRVGKYESKAVNPVFEDPLAGQWHKGVSPTPSSLISLRGVVTASDGELSVRHDVSLRNESGLVFRARYNSSGEYEIKDVPPGEYRFLCAPYGRGTPILMIHGVAIEDDATGILDVSMEHAFSVAGQVVTAEGAPAPGVVVDARWMNENCEYEDFATTDEYGKYIVGAPFSVTPSISIADGGSHPPPSRNVEAGERVVNFVLTE